ncbi:unnamed protein product [Oncorhynchus mykiss]|uniref:Uncharacterized protein n=1 Tax=Oncorhynchus mykiss TaxID=8022 RepID=A0A060XMZ4_ONCMY|nr:unnamed protein product [Oncorhynchus mykiss]
MLILDQSPSESSQVKKDSNGRIHSVTTERPEKRPSSGASDLPQDIYTAKALETHRRADDMITTHNGL